MDPDAAYTDFEESLANDDWAGIIWIGEDLVEWLEAGGYCPHGMVTRGFNQHTAREYFKDIVKATRAGRVP